MGQEKGYSSIAEAVFESIGEAGGVKSAAASVVQVPPLRNGGKFMRWTKGNFHELLRIPADIKKVENREATESEETAEENTTQDSVPSETSEPSFILRFQAMARESLAVFVSPKQNYSKVGYEIILGHMGNMQTLVHSLATKASVKRPNHVCQGETWTSYWVCVLGTKVYVGTGDVVAEKILAILDDKERKAPLGGAEHYVGFSNSSRGDRQAPSPLKIRQIELETPDETLRKKIEALTEENVELVVLGELDSATKTLWDDYRAECEKAKARAAKFGVPYTEPPPPVVSMDWSEARKLRANPKEGFATGMDLDDPEEKAKQEQRRKRFGIPEKIDQEEKEDGLPIGQAWDNEVLVSKLRTDPPTNLWANPPPESSATENEYQMEKEEPPSFVEGKVHIFSIDWAAFKQIRTNDIMKHFSIYGPSYIEWLGDLSCNVCFQDKFSASRVLNIMSSELPTPAPEAAGGEGAYAPDLGNMGWRLGKTMLRKISNDRHGRRGTTARILMRKVTSLDILKERPTSWPKPPPGFSTKRVLGPGSDQHPKNKKRQRGAPENGKSKGVAEVRDVADVMSKGLSSTRDGFSVEEMEAERAKKRARIVEPAQATEAVTEAQE